MILFQNFKTASMILAGFISWTINSGNRLPSSKEIIFPIPPHTNRTLFYVQRSTNTNTVMYEVNLLPDKTINSEDPVSVYWIRYAEKGQKKKLNYIERVLAYGVNCKPYRDHSFMLHFNASESKEVMVLVDAKGQAHATMLINKRKSNLEKIFVTVTEGGWRFPKVKFVEFFGTDLASGEKTYEQMII